MQTSKKLGLLAACAVSASIGWGGFAAAQPKGSPNGLWVDHTGRAAVEISDCSGKLCGKLVWFKEAANASKACGLQIIGDVRPVGAKWDGGWILDPEKNEKYDVEITPLANDRLRVMGYAGMKFLSETFTWTRAAPDLQRCDKTASLPTPAPSATPPPDTGIPFTPHGEPARPGAVPGPGPSTGEGNPPPPPPGQAPQRKTAKKNCTFEIPGINIKVTVPCDEDD